MTSARPSAGRLAVPAKMTSSIFDERTELGACAPSTQAMASTTLDLPLPLGPTTTVTPGSRSKVVASAKDLKPLRVSDRRNMGADDPTQRPNATRGPVPPRVARSHLALRARERGPSRVLVARDGAAAAQAALALAAVHLVAR